MYAAILACAAIQNKVLFLNVYYTHDIDLTIQNIIQISDSVHVFNKLREDVLRYNNQL